MAAGPPVPGQCRPGPGLLHAERRQYRAGDGGAHPPRPADRAGAGRRWPTAPTNGSSSGCADGRPARSRRSSSATRAPSTSTSTRRPSPAGRSAGSWAASPRAPLKTYPRYPLCPPAVCASGPNRNRRPYRPFAVMQRPTGNGRKLLGAAEAGAADILRDESRGSSGRAAGGEARGEAQAKAEPTSDEVRRNHRLRARNRKRSSTSSLRRVRIGTLPRVRLG